MYSDCPPSAYLSPAPQEQSLNLESPPTEITLPAEAPEPTPPAAPENTTAPATSGSAVEGQTLSAGTGSWSGSPTSYAYQWQDCESAGPGCTSIGGATSPSYKLVATDVGHRARVVVIATNAGGSGSAPSGASAAVLPVAPANTSEPTISGSAVEGQTLSAGNGSWSGSPTSFSYEWQDCDPAGENCAGVAEAKGSTYQLAAADVGHTIRVVVTVTNAGGSTPATSAATAIVEAPAPEPPVNTVLPSISGSAVEGQTLTVTEWLVEW